MIRLGVNIDHVATIRNARGGTHPDPVMVAQQALEAGADSITAHLREDRRHVRDADLRRLRNEIGGPLNFEMAATDEMISIACEIKPYACCIVPERRTEITTEGGLDVCSIPDLSTKIAMLRAENIRVSLFIAPDAAQLRAAKQAGAQAVELHTGAYANGLLGEWERLRDAALLTETLGLECHAGHGLNFTNVKPIAALAQVQELNIGHFLIGEAISSGITSVVSRMRVLISEGRSGI